MPVAESSHKAHGARRGACRAPLVNTAKVLQSSAVFIYEFTVRILVNALSMLSSVCAPISCILFLCLLYLTYLCIMFMIPPYATLYESL